MIVDDCRASCNNSLLCRQVRVWPADAGSTGTGSKFLPLAILVAKHSICGEDPKKQSQSAIKNHLECGRRIGIDLKAARPFLYTMA